MSSPRLYGGTYNLFHYTLPKLGITVGFVENPDDPDSWQARDPAEHQGVLRRVDLQPAADVLDFEAVAGGRARSRRAADRRQHRRRRRISSGRSSTARTSWCTRRRSTSAATAPLSAASSSTPATSTGRQRRALPELQHPGPQLQRPGARRTSAAPGELAFILKARLQLLRDIGPAISPFNAFLISQGIETLSPADGAARRQRAAGRRIPRRRATRSSRSPTPGWSPSPWHARQQKYAPLGGGAIVAFEIKGGVEAGQTFADALELYTHLANIGDVRSLVIHPASTTHAQLSAGGAADHRRHPRADPAGGRHRAHRRHPGRPRGRLPRRQAVSASDRRGAPSGSAAARRRTGDRPVRRHRALDRSRRRLDAVTWPTRRWGTLTPRATTRCWCCTR